MDSPGFEPGASSKEEKKPHGFSPSILISLITEKEEDTRRNAVSPVPWKHHSSLDHEPPNK